MERSDMSGKFLSILAIKKEQRKPTPPEKIAPPPPEQAKKSKGKFRFFKK
jgi:hypothetical protein